MGGVGSGDHGGKPTVEDCLVLDLNRLIRQGTFKPGCAWGGSIVWTEVNSGRQVGTIGYEAHIGQESGWVRLHYTTTDHWSGEKTHHDYRHDCWCPEGSGSAEGDGRQNGEGDGKNDCETDEHRCLLCCSLLASRLAGQCAPAHTINQSLKPLSNAPHRRSWARASCRAAASCAFKGHVD